MSPAIREGDWLIARKLTAGTRPVVAGDIVIAHDPRDGRAIVKRVEWADAGYVSLRGDNAAASRDSRHFGPLEASAVESVVVYRYWPPGRIGRIR